MGGEIKTSPVKFTYVDGGKRQTGTINVQPGVAFEVPRGDGHQKFKVGSDGKIYDEKGNHINAVAVEKQYYATLQGMAQTTEKDGKGFNLTDADIAAATTRDTKAGEDRTTKINMRLNANGSARRTHYRDGLWDNSAKDGKYDVTVSDPGTGQKNRKTVTVYSSNYEQKQKQLDEAYENKHWIRKYFQSRESYELSNPRDY